MARRLRATLLSVADINYSESMTTRHAFAIAIGGVLLIVALFWGVAEAGRAHAAMERLRQEAFEQNVLSMVRAAQPPSAHDLADLGVQRRVADSAELMSSLTLVQLAVGLLGTVGVGLALWFNKAAVEHSAAQLIEARKQTRLSQKLGLIQTRAYLSVEKFQMADKGAGLWHASANVRNRGDTPAKNVRIRLATLAVSGSGNDVPWDESLIASKACHRGDISRDGCMTPGVGNRYSAAFIRDIDRKVSSLCLMVSVQYDDVFGVEYEVRSSAVFTGKDFYIMMPTLMGSSETIVRRTGFALELEES